MANITQWFTGLFNRDFNSLDLDVCITDLKTNIIYKELVLNSAINLIANTISLSEFITYEDKGIKKGDDYYLFNVQPNDNYSGSRFWKKLVYQLITKNECLVIMQNEQLYVADNFTKLDFVFKENIYKDITIDDFDLKGVYTEKQVLYFKYNNEDMAPILNKLYADYSQLLALTIKSFKKSSTNKGTLEIPANYPQTEDAQKKLKELIEVRFKDYLNSDTDAVLPLTGGMKFNQGNTTTTKQSGGSGNSRDSRAIIDDLVDLFSMALNIPPDLLRGTITDAGGDINLLMTFCIKPFTELIENEINRKFYPKSEYLKGNYLVIDINNIKVNDLKDVAGALDILTRIGAYTINDSLEALDMEPILDKWANTRFMTKNYEPIETMVNREDPGQNPGN